MDRADTSLIPDLAMANVDPISGVTPLLTVPLGNGATLRQTALDAIERTRWVPERSRNRIRSMVEGRPDWVISRQRAWGVPIALYVNRQTGEYLADKAVNARILDAFREGARMRGSPPITRRCWVPTITWPITSRSTTSSTCGSTPARPMPS